MKMKNVIALFATLIIGLLVITGCQGIFDLPSKPAAGGNGTLLVSVNGSDGRTILPAAKLDSYKLELYVGEGAATTAYTGTYPSELAAGTGISLPGGTYKVVIKGIVDGVTVAEGSEEGVVVPASGAARVNIILTASEEGEGSFVWDLEDERISAASIAVYAIDDAEEEEDLLKGADVTGSVALEAGVYNVKFSVTTGEGAGSWYEILYIYKGMTSRYGIKELIEREVLPPIYTVPASGPGYFYLNLNKWEDVGTTEGSLNNKLPAGELAEDSLTATFTENGQRLNIKLSAAQIALLQDVPYVDITIWGKADPVDASFRYHLGDITLGGGWNATSGAGGQGSGFDTLASDEGIKIRQTVSNPAIIKHLIFNKRAAGDTTVTINKIRIDYPIYKIPAATGDAFYLDLNDWKTVSTSEGGINATPVTGDLTANDLTVSFTENGQRLNIGLTAAQITALTTASDVTITIFGTATPGTTNFRYHLGDPSLGSGWPATSGSGDAAISTFISADGTDKAQTISDASKLKHFILQQRVDTTTSVTITKILIEYVSLAEVLPDNGTDLEDLDDYNGIEIAGGGSGAKIKLRPDGGLYVYERGEDWHGIDLQVADKEKPPEDYETGLDVDKSYRITVKGRAVATDTATAQIAIASRPWGELVKTPLTDFGDVGKIVNFTIVATNTGAEILKQTYNDGSADTFTNKPRIRVMDTDNPEFILDSVELIEWDTEAGEAIGVNLLAYNVPDVLDITGTDLTTADGKITGITGIKVAGNPSYRKTSTGGLVIYNRAYDYDTIDLDDFGTLDDDTFYRITVTGSAVALYGAKIEILQGGGSYTRYADPLLTTFGTNSLNKIVSFEVKTEKLGSLLKTQNIRIRVDGAGFQPFIIDTIEMIALDGEGGEPDGTALVEYPNP